MAPRPRQGFRKRILLLGPDSKARKPKTSMKLTLNLRASLYELSAAPRLGMFVIVSDTAAGIADAVASVLGFRVSGRTWA